MGTSLIINGDLKWYLQRNVLERKHNRVIPFLTANCFISFISHDKKIYFPQSLTKFVDKKSDK